jgi:imidazolonepropionase-like amidohydrolase/dienelactone hydrolase
MLMSIAPAAILYAFLAALSQDPTHTPGANDVRIQHPDGAVFAGTLTLPAGPGPHPTAVLISPPGDHPRDEVRSGGEHWSNLAHLLADVGVASLRVDNRGVGESAGEGRTEWSWTWTGSELAEDVRGHLDWLGGHPELDRNRTGIVAHGDGTLTALRVAAEEPWLAFTVLLSARGLPGARNLAHRQAALQSSAPPELEAELADAFFVLAEQGNTPEVVSLLESVMTRVAGEEVAAQAAAFASHVDTPYMREWLAFDPTSLTSTVEVPLLALNGAADERMDGAANAQALADALREVDNFHARTEVLVGLGHFLEGEEELRLDARVEHAIIDHIADTAGLCREADLPSGHATDPGAFWIRAVTVIDVRAGEPRGPFDVRLEAGRIDRLARPGTAPKDARGVDAKGRFLVPGLWDAHVHLSFWGGDALGLLTASGVTTVRDMGGELDQLDRWRAATRSGSLFGPRILLAGNFLDGPKPNFRWRVMVETASASEAAVRDLASSNVDLIKVHSYLSRPALEAAARTARELGLPLVGHVPRGVSPVDAGVLGYASVEHADMLLRGVALAEGSPAPGWGEAYRWWFTDDGARAMRGLAEHSTCVTPTLVALDTLLPRMRPEIAVLQPWLRDLTQRLHKQGVTLLAGTDTARRADGIEPGKSLVRELVLLTDAGLAPAEALRAATLSPALAMGRTDLGVVEEGAQADLVLVREDPLRDPRALTTIEGMALRGIWYDADELERLRTTARDAARLVGHNGGR